MNAETKFYAEKAIARVRLEFLPRREKAWWIRTIRRTVQWGKSATKGTAHE